MSGALLPVRTDRDIAHIARRTFAFTQSASGAIGLGLVLFVVLAAFIGPYFAPHPPDTTIGPPGDAPSASAWFGTDYVGRDVLSRLLGGGRMIILLTLATTGIAYFIGLCIGTFAGYRSGRLGGFIMRVVDVFLSFPPLLLLLVLLAGAGSGIIPLVLGVAFIQIPGITRLVQTATLEASGRSYVEAAVMRGERTAAILRREIVPNILRPVLADVGLRLTFSVLIISAVNFLGLGLQPPTADWALMISENRPIIGANPLAVLAPTLMLAILTVGVNLVGDAISQRLGQSGSMERG